MKDHTMLSSNNKEIHGRGNWEQENRVPIACGRWIHPTIFLSGRLSNFVYHRMGLCEWMAWMWSSHDHTPFIHNALVS